MSDQQPVHIIEVNFPTLCNSLVFCVRSWHHCRKLFYIWFQFQGFYSSFWKPGFQSVNNLGFLRTFHLAPVSSNSLLSALSVLIWFFLLSNNDIVYLHFFMTPRIVFHLGLQHSEIYAKIFSLDFVHNHFSHRYHTWTLAVPMCNSHMAFWHMTESWLLITQIKYSRVAAQGSEFTSGLAHYTQVSFTVGAQQCIGVRPNGNCNV